MYSMTSNRPPCSLSRCIRDLLHRRVSCPRSVKTAWVLVSPILLSLLVFGCSDKASNSKSTSQLNVVTYGGGAYQDSHKRYFCEPFSKITGITVNSLDQGGDYAKLKTMVESGHVSWHVVEVTAAQFARGTKEGLFQRLSLLPDAGNFVAGAVTDWGVANIYWATVMTFPEGQFSNKTPDGWSDFWDVTTFPGARALYDDPRGNLEFALLADGVSIDALYPLDVDRAFKKLDQLKPHVRLWWTDATQAIQALLSKSVAMSTAWNGRLYASTEARNKLRYSWNQAALDLDYWVIPRGAEGVEAASRFIYFSSLPYPMAEQAQVVGYGPSNLGALELLPPHVRDVLPTLPQNRAKTFTLNADWWSQNEDRLKVRWLTWKAQ